MASGKFLYANAVMLLILKIDIMVLLFVGKDCWDFCEEGMHNYLLQYYLNLHTLYYSADIYYNFWLWTL